MSIEGNPIAAPALQALPKDDHAEVDDTVLTVELKRSIPNRRSKKAKAGWLTGTFLLAGGIAGTQYQWASNHPIQVAEMSRDLVGEELTQKVEGYKLKVDDKKAQMKYKLFGAEENPFESSQVFVANIPTTIPTPEITPTPTSYGEPLIFMAPELPELKPKPFTLPETRILLAKAEAGEGSWSIDGLPTTAEDLIMAKTFIRPDAARPYASVGIMVFDSRRVKLNMVGGKGRAEVGGGAGPGKVPNEELSNLLVVFNGGFQISHARENYSSSGRFVWGAYLDGNEYATLQPGMASAVVFKDGSIKIGAWGEGELTTRTEEMLAVRQNGALMIKDGEVTAAVMNEKDLFTWGKMAANSTDFITWRSAIGVTKDGSLIVANASPMSAYSLAKGLEAAGAEFAMQLDINSPWVQTGVVTGHNADGSPILGTFMNGMGGNGNKFLSPQERDLMYITRDDDSRFVP